KQDKKTGLDYWKTYLEDYENQAVLPAKASSGDVFHQEELRFTTHPELTRRLTAVSNENQVTVSTFFHTVWGILLQKYNNAHDVVYGTVVSGRSADIPGIETAIGLFINTTPVRVKAPGEVSFLALLRQVQEEMNRSRLYEHVPLAEIQAAGPSGHDLIDHIVVVENVAPVDRQVRELGKSDGPVGKESGSNGDKSTLGFSVTGAGVFEQTNYDLDVIVVPGPELLVRLRYNSAVHADHMMGQLKEHLLEILRQVTGESKIPLKEIEVLTPPEREQLIYAFNDTDAEYPRDKTIHQLFQDRVGQSGDNIALTGDSLDPEAGRVSVKYEELNRRADQLACRLREAGVAPDSVVALMIERSVEMMA
ncbi:MAG: AMP-binding protein, partial [bacterium]|nr:AMP-binding protein [bacterium]